MFELVIRPLVVYIYYFTWPTDKKWKRRGSRARKIQISCVVFARSILKNKMHLQTHTHRAMHAHINNIYSGTAGGNFTFPWMPCHLWHPR